NAVTSTSATTTANGDLIFGAVIDDSGSFGTITAGTGFTRRATVNNMDMATEDLVQAAAGPIAATFTFSRSDTYLAQMAAFKAMPANGGGPTASSLACAPASVTSGDATTCTIALSSAAPAGGSTVALVSNNA